MEIRTEDRLPAARPMMAYNPIGFPRFRMLTTNRFGHRSPIFLRQAIVRFALAKSVMLPVCHR
ncbi:MAG TPA: hypothetical protein V6C99_02575 [Oculatellaceae cyanobacterium]